MTDQRPNYINGWTRLAAVLVVLTGLALGLSRTVQQYQQRRSRPGDESATVALDAEALARAELSEARAWLAENPARYDDAIALFRLIVEDYPDTAAASSAAGYVKRCRKAKQLAVEQLLWELDNQAMVLEGSQRFEEAIALFENYSGALSDESREARAQRIEQLRAKIEETQKPTFSPLAGGLAVLLQEGVKQAAAYVANQAQNTSTDENGEAWQQLVDIVARANRAIPGILKSFEDQKGKTVSVDTKSGRMRLPIVGTDEGRVLYVWRSGNADVTLGMSLGDLTDEELDLRAGPNAVGLSLLRLASAATKQDYGGAARHLLAIPSPLRESIYAEMKRLSEVGHAGLAQSKVAQAIALAGATGASTESTSAQLLAALRDSDLSVGMELLLHGVAADLVRQYRDTQWVRQDDVEKLLKTMMELADDDGDYTMVAADTESAGQTNSVGKQASIDWRREIDF
jgi:hypothetical protein